MQVWGGEACERGVELVEVGGERGGDRRGGEEEVEGVVERGGRALCREVEVRVEWYWMIACGGDVCEDRPRRFLEVGVCLESAHILCP